MEYLHAGIQRTRLNEIKKYWVLVFGFGLYINNSQVARISIQQVLWYRPNPVLYHKYSHIAPDIIHLLDLFLCRRHSIVTMVPCFTI